jgi:hypothetical protein
MQGLPDDWNIESSRDYSHLAAVWGKAVPVQAANWIGKALKDSLDGNPQGPDAELIGDREYLIDADKGFSRHYAKKKWYSSPMETVSE